MKLTKTDVTELETAIKLYKQSLFATPETSLEDMKKLNLQRLWADEFTTRLRKAIAGIIREEERAQATLSKESLEQFRLLQAQAKAIEDAKVLTPPIGMPNLSEIERNNPE